MARALITGCSKGIGRATASELTRRGHDVVATARNVESLRDLDVSAKLALDVTDETSVKEAVAAAGSIDVLVNNAGEIAIGPLESMPFDEVRHLYDVNVFGVLRLIQAIAPQMRTRNSGTIVNVSSVTGRVAFPLVGIYCSTKWAIEGLSESLRIELGHFGVRVIVVEPESVGTTARDAPRTYFGKDDPYLPLAAAQTTPPKDQLPTPEQIARTIADAIDANNDVFRWPAGEHAKRLLGMRQQLDDEAFYPQFRAATKLDW